MIYFYTFRCVAFRPLKHDRHHICILSDVIVIICIFVSKLYTTIKKEAILVDLVIDWCYCLNLGVPNPSPKRPVLLQVQYNTLFLKIVMSIYIVFWADVVDILKGGFAYDLCSVNWLLLDSVTNFFQGLGYII